jgi:hypothetical protein
MYNLSPSSLTDKCFLCTVHFKHKTIVTPKIIIIRPNHNETRCKQTINIQSYLKIADNPQYIFTFVIL